MYWKEIPAQVQAEDGAGQASMPLDDRFQEGIDAVSMSDGSSGTDDYLEGYRWGEYSEVSGSAEEAASRIADRFNSGFPEDFVARIIELHLTGKRDPSPGVVDHWSEDDSV